MTTTMRPSGKIHGHPVARAEGRVPFAEFAPPIRAPSPLRRAITASYRREEECCVAALIEQAALPEATRLAASTTAAKLIGAIRAKKRGGGVEGLIQEFALSSQEGVALMCLAEALLRRRPSATRVIATACSAGTERDFSATTTAS